ncbi:hypothetical protein BH11ACT8_BH11ACT8_24980 [soil metagenome]
MQLPALGGELGRYRLERELGRGGMGIVYAARDTGLDREVALKIIMPQWAEDPEYRARFEREALALSRVDSAHVVTVHEYGELDGCLYLVTQLVPDGDLFQLIRADGAMPPAVALDVVAQILDGLADAHGAGVVHRDVKPSNILLRRREGRLQAVLCDFGIATTAGGDVTRTGALVGSFPYMAPERHQGEPADGTADVYSVGCVLWQVLTGTAPYAGSDVEVAYAHLRAPLPQLPGTDAFTTALNAVLAGALAKLPGDRYPSARAMRADVLRAADQAPEHLLLPEVTAVRHALMAGVDEPPAAVQRRRRRSGPLVAVSLSAAVVAATVAVVALTGSPDTPQTAVVAAVGTDPGTTSSAPGAGDASSPSAGDPFSGAIDAPASGTGKGKGTGKGTGNGTGGEDTTPGGSVSVPTDPLPSLPALPGAGGGGAGGGGQPSVKPPTKPTQQPTRQPTKQPTRQPTKQPTGPPAPVYTCWDSSTESSLDACGTPTGNAGIAWVYPSATGSGCYDKPPEQSAVAAATCLVDTPAGSATVYYVQWPSRQAALDRINDTAARNADPHVWRDNWGLKWSFKQSGGGTTPQGQINLYDALPFTVRVQAPTAAARRGVLHGLDTADGYRAPADLRGVRVS